MSEDGPKKTRPNVLISGTPGVGKTSLASLIAVSKTT
jgi:broad-specificity NMP kinase